MNKATYIIRNYQSADFDKYVQLHVEAEKLEPTGHSFSPEVVTEHLNQPDYSPEQNVFLAELAGNIVGYMSVVPELVIGRAILYCWVHPEHRRQGLATKLLEPAMHRTEELGVKVAQVNVAEKNEVAQKILTGLGFKPVRRFLELRLDLTGINWPDADQALLGCRCLRRGEEDKLTEIQNRSFTGTWGYNPNTVEEIAYRTNSSNCSPEDIILASEGDRVTGYCWTGIDSAGEAAAAANTGRIFMLGVDPEYRGRGIGRKVLLAGLAHLKRKGIRMTGLTVDSENEVAGELYRSIGFVVESSSLWYEKAVN